ncbi:C6 finger domain-containing protein [Trichophyton interdigitale]|uniref:C6 finger domain-containing protein n=1 Tax=Trichophyton interdigitale TaxID=101480 RepID=A0A9P5CY90_9EURO|nr:C6 finger domain-containing protein [Trichophyton interdigitale]KAF3894166.1 C6 finger domain-containing protein [Trichophyton interdigitale]KAG8208293.1 C6 finger domain-containing protein [Trichophyton interdigitale]
MTEVPPIISFINEQQRQQQASGRRKGVKQFHRKSRVGCQRCRTKRIKCDETKPVCRNCERVEEPCIYDRLPKDESMEAGEPAETKDRRILELKLMHLYITETGPTIAFDPETSYEVFVDALPRMAFQSDGLLYSIYAVTSLHQARKLPAAASESSMLEHHHRYLQLAFKHHHKELISFLKEKADVIMLTTHLMRLVAFVMLSERILEPYAPPIEWLRITSSNAKFFQTAMEAIGDDPSTCTAKLIRSTPLTLDEDNAQHEFPDPRPSFEHILTARSKDPDDNDDPVFWDDGVRVAYEGAMGYLGSIFRILHNYNGPPGPIRRRIVVFPFIVDPRFIDLVAEGRPRALVILAHFFALIVFLDTYWFVGNTGAREVRAIAAHLPPFWQGLMGFPLYIVENGFTCKR